MKFGMMARLTWVAVAACTMWMMGCGGGAAADEVSISGEITNFPADSIRIWEVKGVNMEPLGAAKVEKDGNTAKFTLVTKVAKPGFFLIGDDIRRSYNMVLNAGETLELKGDGNNPQGYAVTGSAFHEAYTKLQQRVMDHNQKLQGLYQNMQLFAQSDPMQLQRIQSDITNLNNGHFAYLDSLEAQGGFMAKVAKMYNFKPFMSSPDHSKYGNELNYFKDAFFANLDLKDSDIGNMPQLYDKSRAYSSTLVGANLPKEPSKQAMDALLTSAGSGSAAHQSILRGYVAGLEQTKSELFIDYGKLYVSTYPNDQQYVAAVNQAVASMESMASGAMAPDFAAATPSGGSIKLSDLRGQVVMIDFWASWCRPCRQENPNVVKAYAKYHPKGFEILGVSLDENKGKWEAAIEQDGLTWKHVSDLRGWKSEPAAIYGVNSIPATVLIDKEGKIIARNLRGPALEEKLAEIFGS